MGRPLPGRGERLTGWEGLRLAVWNHVVAYDNRARARPRPRARKVGLGWLRKCGQIFRSYRILCPEGTIGLSLGFNPRTH
jgi:hypothetical protein